MRRRVSHAWLDLGYDTEALNRAVQLGRSKERQELRDKRAEQEAVPPRRAEARQWFARMHAVVDAGGEV